MPRRSNTNHRHRTRRTRTTRSRYTKRQMSKRVRRRVGGGRRMSLRRIHQRGGASFRVEWEALGNDVNGKKFLLQNANSLQDAYEGVDAAETINNFIKENKKDHSFIIAMVKKAKALYGAPDAEQWKRNQLQEFENLLIIEATYSYSYNGQSQKHFRVLNFSVGEEFVIQPQQREYDEWIYVRRKDGRNDDGYIPKNYTNYQQLFEPKSKLISPAT